MVHALVRALGCGWMLLFAGTAGAQMVLSAAGASYANATYGIAFTIGEPVIATHAQSAVIATQGFHQPPDELSTVVAVVADPAVQVAAWPNPADRALAVEIKGISVPGEIQLFDALGRIVLTSPLTTGRQYLDVGALSSGTYLARISVLGRYLTTVQLSIAH